MGKNQLRFLKSIRQRARRYRKRSTRLRNRPRRVLVGRSPQRQRFVRLHQSGSSRSARIGAYISAQPALLHHR